MAGFRPAPITMISIHAPRGGSDVIPYFGFEHRYQISIHAPRGGSDLGRLFTTAVTKISIHAPRGGSDEQTADAQGQASRISIHAPRGGSDLGGGTVKCNVYHNFNPRSPWGERPCLFLNLWLT